MKIILKGQIDLNSGILDQNTKNNAERVPIIDTIEPEILCTEGIIIKQFTPEGATIEFAMKDTDNLDKQLTFISQPPSGSNFTPGDTIIMCTATVDHGNENTCSFLVSIPSFQPDLNLFPGFNLFCLPPGVDKSLLSASSLWHYLSDQGISIAKIQAYEPDTFQYLTYYEGSQEYFSVSPDMGWIIYLNQNNPATVSLPYSFYFQFHKWSLRACSKITY